MVMTGTNPTTYWSEVAGGVGGTNLHGTNSWRWSWIWSFDMHTGLSGMWLFMLVSGGVGGGKTVYAGGAGGGGGGGGQMVGSWWCGHTRNWFKD